MDRVKQAVGMDERAEMIKLAIEAFGVEGAIRFVKELARQPKTLSVSDRLENARLLVAV